MNDKVCQFVVEGQRGEAGCKISEFDCIGKALMHAFMVV